MRKVCAFLWILICWEIVHANAHLSSMSDDFYTAAVVEFSLQTTPNVAVAKPERMIETSLNEYLRLINEAHEAGADIVVFPEGLNYIGIATRPKLIKYAVELNESDIYNSTSFSNTCDYSKKSSIISQTSFAARKSQIYVLINVIERSECQPHDNDTCQHALYSSNIVFDRNGCIVSRYRKFNTKMDPMLNATLVPEVQIFHTDFGVTFGHFTSLDILSKYPAYIMLQHGIRHVLYPTLWPSTLPFYTSLQIQQSYSYANDIVLLASSANSPTSGLSGSGIYIGRNGATAMLLSPNSAQQLILSRIPKHIDTFSIQVTDRVVRRFNLPQMDELFINNIPVSSAESLPRRPTEVRSLCGDKICCEFSMRYQKLDTGSEDSSTYLYKLTAFSGRERSIDEQSKEIFCAIVACTTDSTSSCGKRFQPSDGVIPSVKFKEIKINMIVELETTQNDYLVMPTSVDFSILPLDPTRFNFERSIVYEVNNRQFINYTAVLTDESKEILTFGIIGRIFQLTGFAEREEDPGLDLLYLLISLFIGLFTTFGVLWLFRLK